MPTNPPKRIRPPKPRTQPLKRGRACLNCRRLKTKCDGIRPVCGNCARVPKDHPCKFADTAFSPFLDFSPPSSSYSNSPEAQSDTSSDPSWVDLDSQEPPFEMIQMLLQYFLPHAIQFGFFLHVDRFRKATLRPQTPFGDIFRPSLSLLYAVYLWGAHLSQTDSLVELKPVFLKRALQCISTDICAKVDPTRAMQTIQAHVLLANYFFDQKRFLAAQLQANSGATLALGYRLHRLGSPSATSFPLLQEHSPLCDENIRPSETGVEEGERIRGFWAVVYLQSTLNLTGNCPNSISSCILECAGTEIDTPWPKAITDYGTLPSAENQGGEVIKEFLMNEPRYGSPIPTCHAQAAVLLHQASRLAAKWASTQSTDFSSYMTCYTSLDHCIAQFWRNLPLVHPAEDSELVLTNIVIAAASIRLHRAVIAVEPDAQKKCLFAARAILQSLDASTPTLYRPASPVIGPICSLACGVLVEEIESAHMMRAEWARTLHMDIPCAGEDENVLVMDLENGIRIMTIYAAGSPIAEHQLGEIQRQYNGIYGSL
ncbi:hypothetical protein C8R44DRAFT_808227 [Mycena epipterygia]|nr:hypothetical protein C8R44DRAFT_808227 [Mycena epipterygia]